MADSGDKDKVFHLHVAKPDDEDPLGDEAREVFQSVIDDLQDRLDSNQLVGIMIVSRTAGGDMTTSRVLRGEDIPEFYLSLDQIKLGILFEAAEYEGEGD